MISHTELTVMYRGLVVLVLNPRRKKYVTCSLYTYNLLDLGIKS